MATQLNARPMTPEEIAIQAGLIAAPQVAEQEPGEGLSPLADPDHTVEHVREHVRSTNAVGLLVLARFDRVAAQRANQPIVIGQVIECGIMMSDGSLESSFLPADFFAEISPDNHVNIVSSAGHNLTGTMYEKINLNGVEFTNTIATEMTVRQAIATRGEIVRVLRHQPPAPVLDADAPVDMTFPSTVTIPPQVVDDEHLNFPKVMTADGRPIEDPRVYLYRDSHPTALGWQIEWESAFGIEYVEWYSGAIRSANRSSTLAYACLLSDPDEPKNGDMLKIQLYRENGIEVKPPYRVNGVKVMFEYGVEEKGQGIAGLGSKWWVGIVDNSEDIDTILGFDHEDEIDRMNRMQVQGITSGKSSRDATILSLRDREAFKHSIR